MVACVIFYLSIVSCGIFAECILKKNFEDALPVSISGIIFLQFFFGLLGNLALGFWLVIFLTFILYVITFVLLLKRGLSLLRSLQSVLHSKGFWVFTGIYLGLVYALSTLVMRYGDEGSHWGVVVMAMTLLNDFGTNSLANLPFGNYVPGMSLFQYYIEKINFILNGSEKFGDSYLYIAYHTLTAAYLTPLICKLKISRKLGNCVLVVVFMLAPLIFYRGDIFNLYQILQVDAAVGLLSGYAFAMILLDAEEHNGSIKIYILSICSVLSIIKTTGLLFSIMIMCTYIFCERMLNSKKSHICISFLEGVCSVVVPTILWNVHVRKSGGVFNISNAVPVRELLKVLIGKGSSYHMDIRNHFIRAFFDVFSYIPDGEIAMQPYFIVGDTNIHISFSSLFIICFMLFYLLVKVLSRRNQTYCKCLKVTGVSYLILFLLQELGMLIAYLFKFYGSRVDRLDSYNRYTCVVFLSLTIVLICGIVYIFPYCVSQKNKQVVITVGLCVFFLLIPKYDVYRIASRFAEREEQRWEVITEYYHSVSEKIEKQ